MSDPGTKNPQNTCPMTQEPDIRLSSLSLKSVLLHDWWLVKLPDGSGIAVAGLAAREREGSRFFCSAPIVKRHDYTVLEARDGIIITVTGFINHSRTIENGFSSQVCSRFRLGFPHCWEEYATKDCSKGSGDGALPIGDWIDLPVQRIQDLLLCGTLGDSKDFVDDIIGQFFSHPPAHTPAADRSDLKNNTPPSTNTRPAVDKTPIRQKKIKSRGVNETLEDISDTVMEECVSPKRGVLTRRRAASSVSTVNPLPADETPRKNKKAWDGKKPGDTGDTPDVTGVVEQCIDWNRGVSTSTMVGNLKSTHTPNDASHSGIKSKNFVKTVNPVLVDEPPMTSEKTRIGKSKDMGGALDIAGLVEEFMDQHGGVATRSTDDNPKSVHPPRDAFDETLVKTSRRRKKARKSKDTGGALDIAGLVEESMDQHGGVATRSTDDNPKSAHPPRDEFDGILVKTSRKRKKARNGKSKDTGAALDTAGLVKESMDQHGGVATISTDDNPKSVHPPRDAFDETLVKTSRRRKKARKSKDTGGALDISGLVEESMDQHGGVATRSTDDNLKSAHPPRDEFDGILVKTSRKRKKARNGKSKDTGAALDTAGLVKESMDQHGGVATRSTNDNPKSVHPPRDAFDETLVKTSRRRKKARKSKDMGGALDIAGLVEESMDQHGGVATRSTDDNPISVHPPRDEFNGILVKTSRKRKKARDGKSKDTGAALDTAGLVKESTDQHGGVATRSKDDNPKSWDAFDRTLVKTSRRRKKARNGKSKDTIESPDVAGGKGECIDQERGATRSIAGKSKSAHPPSDVAATISSMASNPTPANSDFGYETPVRVRNLFEDKSSEKDVKTKATKKRGDAVETGHLNTGVVTRSMSRLRNLRRMQQ